MPDLFVTPNPTTLNSAPPTGAVPTAALPPANTNKIGLFTTYSESPKDLAFQNQEPDEIILLFLRKDFITNVPWIVFSLLLLFLPVIFMFILTITNTQLVAVPMNFSLILFAFYYLIVASYSFVSFISWYYNASAITNKRILDVTFSELVYKNVAETSLSLVQDVSYTQIGVLESIFDFGDVLIQTAAAIDNFKLEAVPRPQRVVQVTEHLIGK